MVYFLCSYLFDAAYACPSSQQKKCSDQDINRKDENKREFKLVGENQLRDAGAAYLGNSMLRKLADQII